MGFIYTSKKLLINASNTFKPKVTFTKNEEKLKALIIKLLASEDLSFYLTEGNNSIMLESKVNKFMCIITVDKIQLSTGDAYCDIIVTDKFLQVIVDLIKKNSYRHYTAVEQMLSKKESDILDKMLKSINV